jgi:hypothetical protein
MQYKREKRFENGLCFMILTMSFPYQYVENYSTPTTPHSPWEVDQNQPDMFIQEQVQQQLPQQYEPHPTIQLEEQPLPEPERVVLSQQHHEHHGNTIRLYPVHEGGPEEGGSGDAKAHVDNPRHSSSPAGSSSTTMPIRHEPTRPHVHLASHPYRRPQSATEGSKVRAPKERQRVRFASTGPPPAASMNPGAPSRMSSFPASIVPTARCAQHSSELTCNLT